MFLVTYSCGVSYTVIAKADSCLADYIVVTWGTLEQMWALIPWDMVCLSGGSLVNI